MKILFYLKSWPILGKILFFYDCNLISTFGWSKFNETLSVYCLVYMFYSGGLNKFQTNQFTSNN